MSETLITKFIEALRDMAAKIEETVEIEENYIEGDCHWPGQQRPAKRVVKKLRYERDWVAGRLLGMADTAEGLLAQGSSLESIVRDGGQKYTGLASKGGSIGDAV